MTRPRSFIVWWVAGLACCWMPSSRASADPTSAEETADAGNRPLQSSGSFYLRFGPGALAFDTAATVKSNVLGILGMRDNYRSTPAWPALAVGLLTLLGAGLCGCAGAGAPSFEFAGAFFPTWMLCALAGVAGAAAARGVMVKPRLLDSVPYPLAVCTAVGVIVGVSTWLVLST
jgi:hypothetical protein